MSLYIGTDSTGAKVLHITTGANTETDMKAGVLPTTVFHNNYEFLVYDLYSMYSTGTLHLYYGAYNGSYRFYNTTDVFEIQTATAYYILDSNYIDVTASVIWTYGMLPEYGYVLAPNFSSGYYTPALKGSYGYIPADTLRYLLITKKEKRAEGDTVTITSNEFKVGNLDLYNFKYVYQGTLNNHPSSKQITPNMQLIDTAAIAGAISIEAVADNGVNISRGGYTIISSVGGYMEGTGVLSSYTINTATLNTYLQPGVVGDIYVIRTDTTLHTIELSTTTNLLLQWYSYTDYSYNPARSYAGYMYIRYISGNIHLVCEYYGWYSTFGTIPLTLERFTKV